MNDPIRSNPDRSERILLYECFSGIAGDMNLGALVDVGVPEAYMRSELQKLNLHDEFKLILERSKKSGISGTLAAVKLSRETQSHRGLDRIREIVNASSLTDHVKDDINDTFTLLAEAEAKVHGIGINEVHFHEVGATDAIVDISAAAIGLDYLEVDTVVCQIVELGSGMVQCEHGLMPVPAPATAELLRHKPTSRGRVKGEATTPTGAAILRAHVDQWELSGDLRVEHIGYGIGRKDFKIPNVLRLSLGTTATLYAKESNVEIECNIDDMSPEAFEPLLEQLFERGAKDVFMTPIVMKKSRIGTKLTVLCTQDHQQVMIDCLMSESSTIGIRAHAVDKWMLEREHLVIDTSLGQVRVKVSKLPSGAVRWKSEYDDVRALAQKHNRSFMEVKAQVDREIANSIGAR